MIRLAGLVSAVILVFVLAIAGCDQKPKQEAMAPVVPPAVTAPVPVPAPAASAPAHSIREGVGVAGVALGDRKSVV